MPKLEHTVTKSIEPPQTLLAQSDEFITAFKIIIAQTKLRWHAPTVSYDETSDAIEVSWWRADKSLIFTIESGTPVSYLKVWGPNIHTDMEDGENPSTNQLIALWQWLYA